MSNESYAYTTTPHDITGTYKLPIFLISLVIIGINALPLLIISTGMY
ncbi:hypothetical protein LLB_2411 [Legionella longbeachae D-4968]|nr:hypothetical protein LLB_2411 [Legionella longbeachae D-4968]